MCVWALLGSWIDPRDIVPTKSESKQAEQTIFLSVFFLMECSVFNVINTKIIHSFSVLCNQRKVPQAASVLGKDAKFLKTGEQKQKFIFLLGSRRTFRDHLDYMRKLASSLKRV